MRRRAAVKARLDRTEGEREERFIEAHAEGCPPGFEAEWGASAKFRMAVRDRSKFK